MREEAEDAEPVAHRDDDDAALRHALAVVARLRAIAGDEAAAVVVDEHRQTRARPRVGRRPDVEIEAVLAHAGVAEHHVAVDARLHALVGEAVGLAHALPPRRGLRRLPAELSHGRRGERDAAKRADAARQHESLNDAIGSARLRGGARLRHERGEGNRRGERAHERAQAKKVSHQGAS